MATEKRLIDINKFPLLPSRLDGDMSEYERGYLDAQKNMNLLPTVDAEPVKYGKWFFDGDWFEYICTNCRGHVGNRTNYNYCPHCGAYMREKPRKDIPF